MAKPNYQYEKRQKELAKKQKKEEKKQQRKALLKDDEPSSESGDQLPGEVESAPESAPE